MLRKHTGFTLIEMAIVIAILGIITVLAIANYSSYIKRGRRADAINALLSISLAEERYRSNNSQYGTLAQVWGGVTASAEGYYTLSISSVSATGYTATATAQGNQATDSQSGTSCTALTLSSASGTISKTPTACWPR